MHTHTLMQRHHIMLRTSGVNSCSFAEHFPPEKNGALVAGTGGAKLQEIWDRSAELVAASHKLQAPVKH
jgi:hypothetical protein